MTLTLRIAGETKDEFRARAKRAGRIARILVEACLSNQCVRELLASDEHTLITTEGLRKSPIVRVEFEQAIAIGDIGSTLAATRNKHWGEGPQILPLQSDDWFHADRVTYLYRENSLYNRRFEQRRRLKELLGRRWRPLVETGKHHTKRIFLENLTEREARAIQNCISIDPGTFWQAARGKRFLSLPGRETQLELGFGEGDDVAP